MKIVFAPVGTRGDVQPTVALGKELLRRGHDVVICAAANFQSFVEQSGARYAPGGRDVQTVVLEAGERLDDLRQMLPITRRLVAEQFDLLEACCDGADVVVGTPLSVAAPMIAQQKGARFFWAAFFPHAFPTEGLPPPIFPRAPSLLNPMLWWLYRFICDAALGGVVDDARDKRGLPRIASLFDEGAKFPALGAFDDVLGSAPTWRSSFHVTGHWFLDDDRPLPLEVERFLDAGDPPVFLSFGSMPHDDVAARSRAVDRALADVGGRAVVGRGWQQLKTAGSDRVLVVDSVDHAKLFPRCSVVVHHGGAGTTSQAARAGVGQVIVPHMFDQHYWAERLRVLDVAPPPLSSSFSAQALAKAIQTAQTKKAAASSLASKLTTSGTTRAADLILRS